MPLFIFVPNAPAVGGSLFGLPIAPFDTENHIPINSNIVFGIGAIGSRIFDYSSLSIELNGSPIVTAGIPTAGYSLSLERGHFYDISGLVFTINPPSNLASFSTYEVNVEFTSIDLIPYSIYYTFTTSDRSTYGSNFPFGNTNLNRYYFDKNLRKDSQASGLYSSPVSSFSNLNILGNPASSTKFIIQADSLDAVAEVLNQYLGDYDRQINTYLGDNMDANAGLSSDLSESFNNYDGIVASTEYAKADVFTQAEAQIAQTQGQPTPFPNILGPKFGAKVLNNQVDSLKIQKKPEDA